MMNGIESRKVLYSDGKNDECYTPAYAVEPLLQYIPSHVWDVMGGGGMRPYVVWCPFDKEDSEFVKLLSINNKVFFSHIDNGQDFYNYEPEEHWDCIVSNPPFSGKRKIFERALSFGKPFALLMTNTWLNDSAPAKLFMDKQLQLLMFDKRIRFHNSSNKITFSSSYFCYNFLPNNLIFKHLHRI